MWEKKVFNVRVASWGGRIKKGIVNDKIRTSVKIMIKDWVKERGRKVSYLLKARDERGSLGNLGGVGWKGGR